MSFREKHSKYPCFGRLTSVLYGILVTPILRFCRKKYFKYLFIGALAFIVHSIFIAVIVRFYSSSLDQYKLLILFFQSFLLVTMSGFWGYLLFQCLHDFLNVRLKKSIAKKLKNPINKNNQASKNYFDIQNTSIDLKDVAYKLSTTITTQDEQSKQLDRNIKRLKLATEEIRIVHHGKLIKMSKLNYCDITLYDLQKHAKKQEEIKAKSSFEQLNSLRGKLNTVFSNKEFGEKFIANFKNIKIDRIQEKLDLENEKKELENFNKYIELVSLQKELEDLERDVKRLRQAYLKDRKELLREPKITKRINDFIYTNTVSDLACGKATLPKILDNKPYEVTKKPHAEEGGDTTRVENDITAAKNHVTELLREINVSDELEALLNNLKEKKNEIKIDIDFNENQYLFDTAQNFQDFLYYLDELNELSKGKDGVVPEKFNNFFIHEPKEGLMDCLEKLLSTKEKKIYINSISDILKNKEILHDLFNNASWLNKYLRYTLELKYYLDKILPESNLEEDKQKELYIQIRERLEKLFPFAEEEEKKVYNLITWFTK